MSGVTDDIRLKGTYDALESLSFTLDATINIFKEPVLTVVDWSAVAHPASDIIHVAEREAVKRMAIFIVKMIEVANTSLRRVMEESSYTAYLTRDKSNDRPTLISDSLSWGPMTVSVTLENG